MFCCNILSISFSFSMIIRSMKTRPPIRAYSPLYHWAERTISCSMRKKSLWMKRHQSTSISKLNLKTNLFQKDRPISTLIDKLRHRQRTKEFFPFFSLTLKIDEHRCCSVSPFLIENGNFFVVFSSNSNKTARRDLIEKQRFHNKKLSL